LNSWFCLEKLIKKPNREKNRINQIEFLKNRSVGFYEPKTEKTKPKPENKVKSGKTEPNRAKLEKKPSRSI